MAIDSHAAGMPQVHGADAHAGAHAHVHHDPEGSRIGMWLFLYTELLLFGGMFILYGVYLSKYFELFKHHSQDLNTYLGCTNTIFLLTSSWTVAMSITAIQKRNKRLCIGLVLATIGFAIAFFVVKYFEWSHKFHVGHYPGSQVLLDEGPDSVVFYGLYFTMTGLHGLHVLIGAIALAFCVYFLARDKIVPGNHGLLENCALYWHLVDLIWIFLFPLFYLIV